MRAKATLPLLLICLAVIASGCNMRNDARTRPLEATTFFEDGRSSRPLVPGTVARGHLRTDAAMFTGMVDGQPVATIPVAVDKELLERGRDRFNIYCSVCHGLDGYGKGMIVQRGFPEPPSYHIDRLRRAPVGHFYDVITNGYGVMYSYGDRIEPKDRWAIVAYIRTLQYSQNASAADVPPAELKKAQEAHK